MQLCFSVCADCRDDSEGESRGGEGDDDRPDQMRGKQESGGLRRSKRFVRKPSVQTETKYIELMVVNDNDMVGVKGILMLFALWSLSFREIWVLQATSNSIVCMTNHLLAMLGSVCEKVKLISLLRHLCISLSPQFVQLRRSSSQTKNFAKAVVNMADAVRALFAGL